MQAKFETRKIVRTQSLGEVLREARIEQGIRIEDMASRTRVAPQFIENLEKGMYGNLPAQVYVEGFVRKIAKDLRMDENRLLKLYRKESGIQENITSKHKKHDPKVGRFKNAKLILSPTMIRNVVIVFIILLGVGYLWFQVSSLSRPPELAIIQPEGDQEIEADELVVIGQVTETADLAINGQSVYVSPTGEFKETLTLQEGSNTIEIRATNRLGRETVVTRQIFSKQEKVATKTNNSSGRVSAVQADSEKKDDKKTTSGVQLEVAIIDLATWIQVEVDGELEFSGTMLPGSTKSFSGKEYINLTTGKAHKTIVTFNGEEIGALSSEGGVVRDLRFDEDLNIEDL